MLATRSVSVLLLAAGLCLGLAGNAARAQEIRAVATIKPIHSLLAAVLGDVGTAALLVDGTASPHTYTLKPSDAKALNAATLIVRVSDTLEPFMGKVLRSLPGTATVVTLESIPAVKLLPMRAGGSFEAHEDAHGAAAKSGHDHGRKSHARHTPTSAAAIDGHLWLDPDNAKRITSHLAVVLAAQAPAHAARFAANAAAFAGRLDALALELERTLAPVRGRPFIVFHDAYQYLEQRFGMPAAGSVTVSPEVQPGARRLKELRAKVARLGAVCVLSEPQFEPKLVRTIVEGSSARTGVLDPLGAALTPGPELYPALLRNLASSLAGCLG